MDCKLRGRRQRFNEATVCALMVMVAPMAAAQQPADRFLESLESDANAPAEAVALMRDTWTKCEDCDGEEFLTQALALFSEEFRKTLDAYGEERYADCAKMSHALTAHPNPFIAINAAVYEIKAMVAVERLIEAGERIDKLLGENGKGMELLESYSYFAPEIAFLKAFCLLSDLRYNQAADALTSFLGKYPDASQRLTVAGRQMLAEIENHQPGRIAEVADLMTFASRRLTHGDIGESVRTRQERVIELLDRLIEEAEQQENSGGSSSGGGSGGGNNPSGGQSPSSPMQDSTLPGGQAQSGSLAERRRANPGEMWGAMPPAERQRVLQALRDNFPSRYRQLVEQYYEHLAKKP